MEQSGRLSTKSSQKKVIMRNLDYNSWSVTDLAKLHMASMLASMEAFPDPIRKHDMAINAITNAAAELDLEDELDGTQSPSIS